MLPKGINELKDWIDMHCSSSEELLKPDKKIEDYEDLDKEFDLAPDYERQAEMDEAQLWGI